MAAAFWCFLSLSHIGTLSRSADHHKNTLYLCSSIHLGEPLGIGGLRCYLCMLVAGARSWTNVSFVLASSHLLVASARHYGRQMGRPVGSARHQSLIWPLVTLAMLPPVGFFHWNLVALSVNPLLSSASTLAWSLVFSVLLQSYQLFCTYQILEKKLYLPAAQN